MKKIFMLGITGLFCLTLSSCKDNELVIKVGASPLPHAEILNNVIKDILKEDGYELQVKIYQDYVTPNRALNDGDIDANYFQHLPYLQKQIETYKYEISPVNKVHYEPLSLFTNRSENKTNFTNTKISIIDDLSNVERALLLLQDKAILKIKESCYVNGKFANFNIARPNEYIESDLNITLTCIEPGLLTKAVLTNECDFAVIPGNFAINGFKENLSERKVFDDYSAENSSKYSNILAVRTINLNSPKTLALNKAFADKRVKNYIETNYKDIVRYDYQNLL